MKTSIKILVSIIWTFYFVLVIAHVFPTSFKWLMLYDQTYNWVNNSINLSLLIAIALIVRQIWRYKNLDKKTKTNWTILSVFAGTILAIVYPWLIDKKLQEKNKKSA